MALMTSSLSSFKSLYVELTKIWYLLFICRISIFNHAWWQESAQQVPATMSGIAIWHVQYSDTARKYQIGTNPSLPTVLLLLVFPYLKGVMNTPFLVVHSIYGY